MNRDSPSKIAQVSATLVPTFTNLLLAAPIGYATYLCVKPIFASYGILFGVLSVIPFGPLVVAVQCIRYAWYGTWLPVGLILGTMVLGQFLEPISTFITYRILGKKLP